MYFDHTYVGVSFMTDSAASFMSSGDLMHLRMRHVPPMYTLRLRNVHDAIITIFEKWNKFFHFVGHYHPSVWHMIEWFGREEATARTIICCSWVTGLEEECADENVFTTCGLLDERGKKWWLILFMASFRVFTCIVKI